MISNKNGGIGDMYVPLDKAQAAARAGSKQPLADMMFGSWEQGFHKPHHM